MSIKKFLILFLILKTAALFPQMKPIVKVNKVIFGDCKKAIYINALNNTSYGWTLPQKGFGEVQEIKQNNKLTFEEEHNTAWYLLSIPRDGEFTFEIVPLDTTNDYDFLIYSYTDSTFCESFQKNKLKPVRTNLSNTMRATKGRTGLKPGVSEDHVGKGIGNSYSRSMEVKKGEKYMLILDNVSPDGRGHTVFFNFVKDIEINDKIVNSDNVPVVADITLSDNQGNVVAETRSDENGNYSIKTKVKDYQNYSVTVVSDSDFVQTKIINTKDLKGAATFKDLKIVLPKLKKGNKYRLGNINFYAGETEVLPESIPSLEALYKLMKKNKHLSIQIEGHINADYTDFNGVKIKPTKERLLWYQKVSEDRALTIYNYLSNKNIDRERMITIGFGGTNMIFPNPINDAQSKANRRVEIKVISINGEYATLASAQNNPQEYARLIKKADSLYFAKNYKGAGLMFSAAFKANGGRALVGDRYNAACAWALANYPDSAFFNLNFITITYNDYDHLTTDADLISLHTDKRWQPLAELVKKNKAKADAKLNKPVIVQLDSIYAEDQNYRHQVKEIKEKYGLDSKEMKDLWKIINRKDSINLIAVKKILATYGWLGSDVIGARGNSTLFLVIQHADQKTQEYYLPVMREAMKIGNAYPDDLALLEDRVALGQGKKQIYGTQSIADSLSGKWIIAPIEDEENVNKRRAEVGLGPIEEYAKQFGLIYEPKKAK